MLEEKQKNIIEKIKKKILNNGKLEKNGKRKIENLVTLVIILIITVIAINSIWDTDKNKNKNKSEDKVLAKEDFQNEKVVNDKEEKLEKELENILESISGVGKVKVLLTYSESSSTVAMYNEDISKSNTEEKDSRWWK